MVELQLNHWSNHCLTEIKDYRWLSKGISFLGGLEIINKCFFVHLARPAKCCKGPICKHYHMYTYMEHTHIYGLISPMWSHLFSLLTQKMILVWLVCWIYPTRMPVTTRIITFFLANLWKPSFAIVNRGGGPNDNWFDPLYCDDMGALQPNVTCCKYPVAIQTCKAILCLSPQPHNNKYYNYI